jgi:AhpD family alkylhydroperoxidase
MGSVSGRITLKGHSKDGYRALAGLTRAGHPDHVLSELVKLRASRLNNCRYCIDNHTAAAQKAGIDDGRIAATADWADSSLFDAREAAALALTDLLTVTGALADAEGADAAAAWDAAAVQFPGEELTQLVITIAGINTWNRVMIAEEVSEAG